MQLNYFLKRSLLIIIVFLYTGIMMAQQAYLQHDYKGRDAKKLNFKSVQAQTLLLNDYDVKFYKLDIAVERASTDVAGNVTIMAQVVASVLDTFAFELIDALVVDSVLVDGINSPFTRAADQVFVEVLPVLNQGDMVTAQIFYAGAPPSGGFFTGISNASSPTWGNQITWTLSESFNAKQWFPVKQVLSD